jgi:hypothetical protein
MLKAREELHCAQRRAYASGESRSSLQGRVATRSRRAMIGLKWGIAGEPDNSKVKARDFVGRPELAGEWEAREGGKSASIQTTAACLGSFFTQCGVCSFES